MEQNEIVVKLKYADGVLPDPQVANNAIRNARNWMKELQSEFEKEDAYIEMFIDQFGMQHFSVHNASDELKAKAHAHFEAHSNKE